MEIKKPISSVVEAQKSRPVLFIFSILLLAGLVAFAFYLSFARTAIQDQQKQLDDQIVSLSSQITALKSQNIEGQQYAQQWLADLQKTEIRWSKVIKTIQDLLPVDPLTQASRVQFLSYSGSAGGKLTLNAQTTAGSADPFGDVSTLLNVFNNSSYFKDAYVPSVSHGVSQSGQDLLSFVFNVTYQEQLPAVGVQTLPTVSTQQTTGTNGAATPGKVSRTPNQ